MDIVLRTRDGRTATIGGIGNPDAVIDAARNLVNDATNDLIIHGPGGDIAINWRDIAELTIRR